MRRMIVIFCFVLSAFVYSEGGIAAPAAVGIEFWNDSEESSGLIMDHSLWQGLLDTYLKTDHPSGINRFDYRAVTREDRRRLDQYIGYLEQMEPRQLNKKEQKAYWINFYNALTARFVLDGGSRKTSIREVRSGLFTPGPWERRAATVASQDLTLDDIEHGILRPFWQDNRIHYAVNCASIGCPHLQESAFTGENTEELLEKSAKEFINHPRAVRIDNGKLFLSSLYDWYVDDFGGSLPNVIQHLSQYLDPEKARAVSQFRRASYSYDWQYNTP